MLTPYESGSQVALGRELVKSLEAKWMAEGKSAAMAGDTSALWNSIQWAAYHSATFTGDPAVARWRGEGAQTCNTIWSGDYSTVVPAEQRDGYIGD